MNHNPNQPDKKSDPKPGKMTISLALAKVRITRWLETVATIPYFKKNPQDIPRAIYVSFDDIKELLKAYPERELKGIRLYFGLAGEIEPEPASMYDLRGMIVPVFHASQFRPHADLVLTGDVGDPNDTAIYDFTSPCPAYCDVQSELYVPYEDIPVSK